MKTPLVLLLVCVAVAAASPLTTEGYQSLFAKWVNHHSKVYGSPDEMFKRYNIWRENLDYIMAHPAKNKTHTLAMNAFGDLSNAEFTSIYNNYLPSRLRQNTKPRLSSGSGLPDSVDWVASGAVTPIKNQGQCGSCWSFSTTGAIEGINFITNNQLISLSEQELVDCSGSSGTAGCNGGDMGAAMGWVASNGGLCTEQDYPYTAVQGTCQTTCTSAATISGSQDVTANSEDELQNAVAQQPVSVAVDAGGTDWQFYSGGVLSDSCGTDLDHGVLAVGYGNLNGVDHWKVKNSWGASWGAAGYIYLQRGSGSGNPGQCGIAMEPVYPVA